MSQERSHDIRFISDAMLGRLARWLRLLGFDTLYYPHISNGDLLKVALREERCLLTRDTHFKNRKRFTNLFFVRSDDPLEQVVEVLDGIGVKPTKPSRCAQCNGILGEVPAKESVRDMVPEYVFRTCRSFSQCESCGNVYWEGTHLKRFKALFDLKQKEYSEGRHH